MRGKYFAWLFLIMGIFVLPLLFNINSELRNLGDSGSEANVLTASRYFQHHGFWPTRLLPVHNAGLEEISQLRTWVYTRYPPGPDLLGSAIQIFTGSSSLWVLRILPLLCSLGGIALFFSFITRWLGSPELALMATIFYCLNGILFRNADNFHGAAYADFIRMLGLNLSLLWARQRSSKAFFGLLALAFFGTWMNIEYIPYLVLSFSLLSLWESHREKTLGPQRILQIAFFSTLLFLTTCLSFALHYLQNAAFFASFTEAFQDLAGRASARLNVGDSYWTMLKKIYPAIQAQFGLKLRYFPFLILAYLSAWLWRRDFLKRLAPALALLFICDSFFILVFRQWSGEHFQLVGARHVLPFWSLLLAGALWANLGIVFSTPGKMRRSMVLVSTLGVGLIGLKSLILFAEAPQKLHTASLAPYAKVLRSFRDQSPPDALFIGNFFWRPEARFYIGRHSEIFETMKSLQARRPFLESHLPLYYVFFERWGPINEDTFPNFLPEQIEEEEASRAFFEILKKNAEKVDRQGRFTLFRLKSLAFLD